MVGYCRYVDGACFSAHSQALDTKHEARVPMVELDHSPARRLVLSKQGRGRCYFAVSMRAVSRALRVAGLARGYTLARRYVSAEGDGVAVVTGAEGAVHVELAELVRVELSVSVWGSLTPQHYFTLQ